MHKSKMIISEKYFYLYEFTLDRQEKYLNLSLYLDLLNLKILVKLNNE